MLRNILGEGAQKILQAGEASWNLDKNIHSQTSCASTEQWFFKVF